MPKRYRRTLTLLCAAIVVLLVLRFFGFSRQDDQDRTVQSPEMVEVLQEPRLVIPKNDDLPKASNPSLPSNASSNLRIRYQFEFLLQTMGYSAPRPRTAERKVKLDQFFDTAQHFAITKRERAVFIDLWQTFDRFCGAQNFTYFLFYGSIVGAYRHHAMVPWDDDLDLLMPVSDMGPLIVLLKEHAELESAEQSFFVHRVFFRDPRKSLPRYGQPWSWPYLEVHFYRFEGDRIHQTFNSCPKTSEADLFPVLRVPFEGHLAPVPRCMDRLVTQCYGNVSRWCCTKNFDHRRGEDLHDSICVECSLLKEVFPFVTQRRRLGVVQFEETLTLNGTFLSKRRVTKGRKCG